MIEPDEPFRLVREPETRRHPTPFLSSARTEQRKLFAGLNELPGQEDLFGTDGLEKPETPK